jgi:acetylornithine deacetylase/succinyl-diaminopimelate desuccinylase-like protein
MATLLSMLLTTTLAVAPATDAVSLLTTFVQTRTVNPPGGESALTEPLARRLAEGGVEVELLGATPGRKNLIARIPGTSGAKPWLVLAHVDTVLADPKDWRVDPFAATVSGGVMWGRGTLDDKGMAAALASALLRLAARPEKPAVGIIAVFAVDEETGSSQGIEWLLNERPALYDVQGVLNEGGFVLLEPGGPAPKTYYVSVGEKGVAWMKLTATGTPGHGSIRWGDNANETLVGALEKVLAWPHPRSAKGPMFTWALEEQMKAGKVFRSAESALMNHPLGKQIERDPKLKSTLSDTCNVTVLKAGEKPNVIPAESSAVLDCRVVPGQTPEAFRAALERRVANPKVKVELLTQSTPSESPWRTPFFAALTATAQELDAKALVVPVLAAGATDSRFWRERGVPAYGIVPIPVPPDYVQGMHGKDERVPVAGVVEAGEFLTRLLTTLASGK